MVVDVLKLWWVSLLEFLYLNPVVYLALVVIGYLLITILWLKAIPKGSRFKLFGFYLNMVLVWLAFCIFVFWSMITE